MVAKNLNTPIYNKYIKRKKYIIVFLILATVIFSFISVTLGSTEIDIKIFVNTLLGKGSKLSNIIIWNIRLPRIISALIAGAGLSVAGCVMQNNLRNPLASPQTLGILNAAAFGANIAIIIINNPYIVTISAFFWAIIATIIVLFLAKFRNFTPEAMILSGVALNSLFSAGIILIQYFADDTQIASAVFWSFGDLGRTSWHEILIMFLVVLIAIIYFIFKRWDYNSLEAGEETAKSLGVNTERLRIISMIIASIITAVLVSFLGIIGFVGLVAPHIMKRFIGGDYRFLIPGSIFSGALLLVVSDTIARTVISPIILPVGTITSFFGAPLFIYILSRRYKRN
jgi:iron complex transport system permease protein